MQPFTFFYIFAMNSKFFLSVLSLRKRPGTTHDEDTCAEACVMATLKEYFHRQGCGGLDSLYMGKAFTSALFLDNLKSRKFPRYSQDKATVDAHGMFFMNTPCLSAIYVHTTLVGAYVWEWQGVSYINHRRGFLRCSFNCIGQCESLKLWNE